MKNLFQYPLRFKFASSNLQITCIYSIFVLSLLILSSIKIQAQEPVLKHSYSFDDGTAKDVVGEAHGTINGGKVIDGEYVTFLQGHYIELPADKIKINTYKSLTLEAYLVAGHINGFNTMISYFGNSVGDWGTDHLFQAVANGGNSVTAISCKNNETPWAVCTNVFSNPVKDLNYHHVVSTFDNHEIKFYIDGILVNSNTIEEFPDNVIANISNKFAYLCKSGYKYDPTWFGTIDKYNIYEGILDPELIANSANRYLEGSKEVSREIKEILSNVLVNPGFRPENELSETFVKTYKQSKFIVYPTIIRTVDTTTWSETSAKEFLELLESDLELNVAFNKSILNPGELEGRGQFDFFKDDMERLGSKIEEVDADVDYNMILEILFQPQQSESLYVFGIHIFILNHEGENAFSFLLNSHHDYFSYNNLFIENSDTENLEMLKLKCTKVATDALKKQIENAENEIAN